MRLPELDSADIPYRFLGTTALDRFVGLPASPILFAEAETDMVRLATLFDQPSFPGLPAWDLLVRSGGRDVFLRGDDGFPGHFNPLMTFSWDPVRRAFQDPHGLYPLLKDLRSHLRSGVDPRVDPVHMEEYKDIHDAVGPLDATTAAIIASRLPVSIPRRHIRPWVKNSAFPPLYYRNILVEIVGGPWPDRGLEILRTSGFLADILPELDALTGVDHSKEGHPEGNGWRHTIETFRYRKSRDITVGLALLLHDCGKPFSLSNGERRFDGHADIGSRRATEMLRRLEFSTETIETVRWLVRFHMIPGALHRLPDHRRDPIMRSPLFPLLLEVYRCDLSSTFRGPENYYRACTIYRRFLKSRRREAVIPSREMMAMYIE